MQILEFKTTINCSDCVKKVSPFLDRVENIKNWEVNTLSPEKTLTVRGKAINSKDIIRAAKRAGFKATFLREGAMIEG